MDTKKYPVPLSAYDYRVLTKSKIIALMIGDQLEAAKKKGDQRILAMTRFELEELTGWLAAESNHAYSQRVGEELGNICDQLEALLSQIKRALREEK